jgi:hypothetical protein
MKKIILILLVLLFAFSGAVYADGNQKFKGNKLVGMGKHGINPPGPPDIKQYTCFAFTNPDSVEDITIEKVLITRGDGSVVYEGPFIQARFMAGPGIPPHYERTIIDEVMPHEIKGFCLTDYFWVGPPDDSMDASDEELTNNDNWMPRSEAENQGWATYTVEIQWDAKGGTCALTGWQRSKSFQFDHRWETESPMVNRRRINRQWKFHRK